MKIPPHPSFHTDSENAYFARQLEAIRARVLEVLYGPMKAMSMLPLATGIHPGAESYTYRVEDMVGAAALVHDLGEDGPTVDVKGEEVTSRIRSAKARYIYTVQDVRNAMLSGRDLPMGRARAARKAIAQKMDNVMLLGDGTPTYLGLRGLFRLANASTYTVATGAGGSKLWSSKTAEEILADLHGIVDQIEADTNENFVCTDLVLPLRAHQIASRKRIGPDTGETVLKHFLATRAAIGKPVNVSASTKLNGLGSGPVDRMVAYVKDADCIEAIMPIAFEQFAPQYAGPRIITDVHGRTGGVVAYHPKTVVYGDGISAA